MLSVRVLTVYACFSPLLLFPALSPAVQCRFYGKAVCYFEGLS